MAFCENCGKTVEPGIKFCENCGVPVDGPPIPRAMQPSTSQGSPVTYPGSSGAAPMTGIAYKFVGGFPLYTIIGVCGVVLLVLSIFITCDNTLIYQSYETMYVFTLGFLIDHQFGNFLLTCPVIIGIVGGIIGLLKHSWKAQVLSGLISFIILVSLPSLVGSWQGLQIPWLIVDILGGILLVIAGLMMRTAASSATHS